MRSAGTPFTLMLLIVPPPFAVRLNVSSPNSYPVPALIAWLLPPRSKNRLNVARGFGAIPVHLTEENPRDVIRKGTPDGRGVDVALDERRPTAHGQQRAGHVSAQP